jgi:hypothetical protein
LDYLLNERALSLLSAGDEILDERRNLLSLRRSSRLFG